MKIMGSDTARSHWREVVDSVMAGEIVLVERYRKPVVVVIPYAIYLAIAEQLEDLYDLRLAEAAHAEYLRDPSGARPIEDLIAEREAREALIKDDSLDE